VELLRRKSYGSIRVSDITKKAGVGRATFYAHYASKDDLLRSQFSRIVAPMLAIRPDASCPLDATNLFAHIQGAPRLFTALIGGAQAGSGPRVLRECFERRVREALNLPVGDVFEPLPAIDSRQAMLTRFVASSLLGVLGSWLEHGAEGSAHEIQDFFSRIVGNGLSGVGATTPPSFPSAFHSVRRGRPNSH
jgi:AcrR family transcriptional regulator